MQLKPIFIQKEVPALVFPDRYLNFLTTTCLKREKKHCYEKHGSDISRKSNYATFYVTSPKGVSTVHSSYFHKTIHFLSVSDGPISTLSDIVIILRKSHETIFVTYFRKTKNICERCFWDVSEVSRKIHIFFEISLRRLKDVTQKTSFLRCFWGVLKTSQKRHHFWDVSERSLRYLSQWRPDWDLLETSHAGWVCFVINY